MRRRKENFVKNMLRAYVKKLPTNSVQKTHYLNENIVVSKSGSNRLTIRARTCHECVSLWKLLCDCLHKQEVLALASSTKTLYGLF